MLDRGGKVGLVRRVVFVFLPLLMLAGRVDPASAQVPVRVETPYTLIDAETRTMIQVGAQAPLRGNEPLTGYAYAFLTRPKFLHEDLYLRMVIAPVYADAELIRNRWPSTNSALGFGVAGGLFAASHVEFRGGHFEKRESFSGNPVDGTLAYYLRGPKIGGPLPLEGQIRLRPMYVLYDRNGDTSRDFRLPKDSAIYETRTGVRVGGVPPKLFPEAAMEASLWHSVRYRDIAGTYGLAERPQETEHLTQKTWTRLGMILPFRGAWVSAFLNGGIAEDTDPLSAFRLGGGLGLRAEFPLLLHGYYVDEVFARRFLLANLAYRFPIWPGQDRVHLEVLADYARVAYLAGHRLPHDGLAGMGLNVSWAVTKCITAVVGYGYGIDAPRSHGYGGHAVSMLIEFERQPVG